MRWEQPIRYASISDIGFRRRNNQDACAVRICSDPKTWREHGHLLMVADGMGGHAVGELASKIAADTVCHTFFKLRDLDVVDALRKSLETANATINERGSLNRDFARMGTTCTSLALCSQGAVIGHVGDSRAYRIRGDRIDQLTFDHSLHWELMRQGRMRPDDIFMHESRHVITRSLGPEPTVQIDIEGPYPIFPGDVYLLCSDGLTGHVQDAEIGIIARELPPQEACRLLVNLANLRGGSDNITVVAVHVGGAGDSPGTGRRGAGPAGRGTRMGLADHDLAAGPAVRRGRDRYSGGPVSRGGLPRRGGRLLRRRRLCFLARETAAAATASPRGRRDRNERLEAVSHRLGPVERGLLEPSGQLADRVATRGDGRALVDRLARLRSRLYDGARIAGGAGLFRSTGRSWRRCSTS